jgi:hypothetical protein
MAITVEQWKKKQAQLNNGWKYSLDCYSKDQVKKEIPLENGEKLVCTLYFTEEFDKSVWRYTGFNLIKINISLYRPCGDVWTSSGLGKTYQAEEKFAKKLFKYLVMQSEKTTDDFIRETAKANDQKLRNANVF